jgi:hypothetical protein
MIEALRIALDQCGKRLGGLRELSDVNREGIRLRRHAARPVAGRWSLVAGRWSLGRLGAWALGRLGDPRNAHAIEKFLMGSINSTR